MTEPKPYSEEEVARLTYWLVGHPSYPTYYGEFREVMARALMTITLQRLQAGELELEIAGLKGKLLTAAERIAAQSELLSKRAEKAPRDWSTVCVGFEGPAKGPPCCERAGEYNGFGSDGPTVFTCPKGCGCHD